MASIKYGVEVFLLFYLCILLSQDVVSLLFYSLSELLRYYIKISLLIVSDWRRSLNYIKSVGHR